MTQIIWIEATNSGGAKEVKQREPCIFANMITVLGVLSEKKTCPRIPIS